MLKMSIFQLSYLAALVAVADWGCVISCVGVDGDRPEFVVSLRNLELSLPPMSQKGKKCLLLITKKLAELVVFQSYSYTLQIHPPTTVTPANVVFLTGMNVLKKWTSRSSVIFPSVYYCISVVFSLSISLFLFLSSWWSCVLGWLMLEKPTMQPTSSLLMGSGSSPSSPPAMRSSR